MRTILSSWSTLTHWKWTINVGERWWINLMVESSACNVNSEERRFDVSQLRAKCSPVWPIESQNCCMAWLLSQQEDFINQESMLETLIKEKGHLCLILPKFHCELNPVEMVSSDPVNFITMLIYKSKYWGWCKYRYREYPKATFAEAKECALEVLDTCPKEVIQKFINRSLRFIDSNKLGKKVV